MEILLVLFIVNMTFIDKYARFETQANDNYREFYDGSEVSGDGSQIPG